MKTLFHLAVLAAAGLLTSGCATMFEDPAVAEQQRREDAALMEEKFRRIEGRLEAVELELQRIQARVDALPRSAASDIQSIQAELNDLSRRIQTVDAAREKDKQEIIDKLSGKIASMVSHPSSSGGSTKKSTTKATSGTGYEHVVEAGQTLSAIASAYGVKSSDIIQANNLDKPDSLRVGQKLFIPAP